MGVIVIAGLEEGLIPRGFPGPEGMYTTSFGSGGGEEFEMGARGGGNGRVTDGCTFRRLSNGTLLLDANAFSLGPSGFIHAE